MPRHASETPLAIMTLVCTLAHFIGETWVHMLWGQPLQALIVDYICNALMVLGVFISLRVRPGSGAGLLAVGWAFALGFGWRSVFGRLEDLQANIAPSNGEPRFILTILIAALVLVAAMLIWSLWLAIRQAFSSHET